MAEHGKLFFVSHDLILISDLCTLQLKGPIRREAYVKPFFCVSKISFGGSYSIDKVEHGKFFFISHDLILISNLYMLRLKGPIRREAHTQSFFHISKIFFGSSYSIGRAEHGKFFFISHDLILVSNIYTLRLKGPVRREAYVKLFFCISKILFCSSYSISRAEQ